MDERVTTIAAELGYLRGLIDALRTAPETIDVGPFLDRLTRAVTALEAVRAHLAFMETKSHEPPSDESDETRRVLNRAAGEFSNMILKDIANALAG